MVRAPQAFELVMEETIGRLRMVLTEIPGDDHGVPRTLCIGRIDDPPQASFGDNPA